MNNYLTTKVTVKSKLNIVILVICSLFVISGSTVIKQQFEESTSQGIISIALTVLFAIPVVKIILSYIKMNVAKKYAYVFANNTDTTITFSELRQHLHKSNVEDELQNLIMKGYIKNVVVDLNTQTILLTSEKATTAKKIYVEVTCKGCGNAITIVKGEATKCPYCDRSLLG
ncbi:MAG: hypothetical protein IJV15_03520 [Lachnospiraceae bacterium]|nr:hypothetical protein [Lachnospiraceae bacterium]